MNTDLLLQEADRCVKCGLCLPHCPTYRLYRDEAESPRGRISLIQAVASGALEADPSLMEHLDRCLLCRRCENSCPSDVRYTLLIDAARSEFPRSIPKWLPDQLSRSANHGNALRIGRFLGRMGLGKLLSRNSAGRLLQMAADSDSGWKPLPLYPALSEAKGKVALFAGCTGSAFDSGALQAAIQLLTLGGFVVSVPAKQGCCGGAHAHSGYTGVAREMERQNLAAFNGKGFDAIVILNSGCGLQLMEQDRLDAPVWEMTAFLHEFAVIRSLPFRQVDKRVAVHTPCSLHSMKQRHAMIAALESLPGSKLFPVSGAGCCGGAGLHMLTQAEQGSRIAASLVEKIKHCEAEVLVTANIGCGLHLRQQIAKAGLAVNVMHPVELMADFLEKSDESSLFTRRSTGFGA